MSSTHVGRHETQAQSFTFTPLHVGNHDLGYRHAPEFGSDGGGKGTGISLGMALAISGAAASPAMGMYSTKSRAFLLTLANARLGLWFGNPQDEATWQSSEPPLGVGPVLRELLGLTTDHNPYVYLSDGGHYENLGLWEMVSRRCRFIVVSDAGADPQYTFDDLANAVRRIRLDLGIPILFDPIDVTRQGQNDGNPHAAIGRIRYAVVDGDGVHDGIILYLKATLSGDEPVDVRNFATDDPLFPHDSTANQFFDEARFESYRTLGFHTVLSVASGLRQFPDVEALCDTARAALSELEARRRAGARHRRGCRRLRRRRAAERRKFQDRIPVAGGALGGQLSIEDRVRLRVPDAVGKQHVEVPAVRDQHLRPGDRGLQRLDVRLLERRLEAGDQQLGRDLSSLPRHTGWP